MIFVINYLDIISKQITGYGGTKLEENVPDANISIKALDDLIDYITVDRIVLVFFSSICIILICFEYIVIFY